MEDELLVIYMCSSNLCPFHVVFRCFGMSLPTNLLRSSLMTISISNFPKIEKYTNEGRHEFTSHQPNKANNVRSHQPNKVNNVRITKNLVNACTKKIRGSLSLSIRLLFHLRHQSKEYKLTASFPGSSKKERHRILKSITHLFVANF